MRRLYNIALVHLLLYCVTPTAATTPNNTEEEEEDEAASLASCPISPPMLPKHLLEFYINGQWVAPQQQQQESTLPTTATTTTTTTLDVINPSFDQSIAKIALGSQADTDAAVAAARNALPLWSINTTLAQRQEYVERLLTIYKQEQRQEEMAQLMSAEMGSPIDTARQAQVGAGNAHIEQFLRALEFWEPQQLVPGTSTDPQAASTTTTIRLEPIGVVALITPWNWPMNQVTLKVIPALLVGCTCVLKPSEMAPLSSLLFAEMMHEAGFPPGVFNLVNGNGQGVGTQLSSHLNVDMISFTGSTRAGRLIAQAAAASNLKKVSLELGGKGANIIFEDVGEEERLEQIVQAGVWSCFDNSGQSCNAPTRMLVQTSLYDKAVRIATALANDKDEMRVDTANKEGDFYGPVSSKVQFERVQQYIQTGMDQGAKLVAGGVGRPEGTNNGRGFFVRPTVFVDVTPNMTISQEEIFGPVLSIMRFDTEEEAVDITNNGTPYGLTNHVWTQDLERRRRLAKTLKSGMIEMNGIGADDGAPFAAMRASGNGREGGVWGLEDFTVVKVVSGVEHVRR